METKDQTIEKLRRELEIELGRAEHYRDQWQAVIRERDEAEEEANKHSDDATQFENRAIAAERERDEALAELANREG